MTTVFKTYELYKKNRIITCNSKLALIACITLCACKSTDNQSADSGLQSIKGAPGEDSVFNNLKNELLNSSHRYSEKIRNDINISMDSSPEVLTRVMKINNQAMPELFQGLFWLRGNSTPAFLLSAAEGTWGTSGGNTYGFVLLSGPGYGTVRRSDNPNVPDVCNVPKDDEFFNTLINYYEDYGSSVNINESSIAEDIESINSGLNKKTNKRISSNNRTVAADVSEKYTTKKAVQLIGAVSNSKPQAEDDVKSFFEIKYDSSNTSGELASLFVATDTGKNTIYSEDTYTFAKHPIRDDIIIRKSRRYKGKPHLYFMVKIVDGNGNDGKEFNAFKECIYKLNGGFLVHPIPNTGSVQRSPAVNTGG